MKIVDLIVTVERRYIEYNNNYYVKGVEDNTFFNRYLDDFNKVYILARVSIATSEPMGYKLVNSEKIKFLPIYSSSYGIFKLRTFYNVIKFARNINCKIIIRTPGLLAYFFSLYCFILNYNFSLEIVTDPYEEAINSTQNSILNKFLGFLFPLIFKFQIKYCNLASFVTKYSIQKKYISNKIDKEKIKYSYSSINLPDSFYQSRKHPIIKDNICLLFMGVLDRNFKGLDIFLNILNKLPSIYTAKVVGDGILLNSYKNLADKLGVLDRVSFLGYISDEKEKQKIYSQSDIFILTSRREGLPRVVIEAMANSLPCICSDVSGVRELIPDEYIFPINDIDKAYQLIINMSFEDMYTQGDKNFLLSKEYSLSKIIPKRRKFYNEIINF